MAKRYRRRSPKPRELIAYLGRIDGEPPDLIFAWGDGIARCDAALLNHALTQRRAFDVGESLFDELKKRGYDLDTLRFSIKKPDPVANEGGQ